MKQHKVDIYPEVKKIAGAIDKINRLSEKLSKKLDDEGIEWCTAKLITGCSERNGHLYKDGDRLDNGNGETEYYVNQEVGYCGDDFHGYLYFKTNVPGQFVQVHFDM